MINGRCISYLDEYKNVKWPEIFVDVPEKGSRIESLDGKYAGRVNNITHIFNHEKLRPEIVVELVTRPMKPHDFPESWDCGH